MRDRTNAAHQAELPLAARIPNPPALFVGRAAEIRWVREAIPRAPVTVVAGEGGAGKSALVLFALHARFPERIAGTVFVSLRGADPREGVALAAARALVRATGIPSFDWSDAVTSPEAASALAIDLADAADRWVLLDDLHGADPEDARVLLGQISRYARRSRWITTTRAAPRGDALAGQVLELGGMKEADLAKLARALEPAASPESVRLAVAAAGGSPWRLRQARPGDRTAPPPSPEALAAGLDEETLAFLQAVVALAVPLRDDRLLEVAPRPSLGLDALERRGLLDRTAQGVRAHELTRELVPPAPATPQWAAWRARAGAALAASEDAAQALRGVQLLIEAGAIDEAAAAVGHAGEALLEAGYAASLGKTLDAVPRAATPSASASRALETWRLRCAVELGDAAALAAVARPEGASGEVQLLWAKLLLAKGQLAQAAAEAEEVQRAAAAAGDADLAFRAGIVRARGVANGGDLRGGLAIYDALEAPNEAAAALRDARRAMVLAMFGDREGTLARALPLRTRIPDLPWPLRGEVAYGAARALYQLGRLREAGELLDAALAATPRGSVRFDVGRTIRHARACITLESGDLARARTELDNLLPYLGRGSLLQGYTLVARGTLHLAEGALAEVERAVAELSGAEHRGPIALEIDALALRTRILRRDGLAGDAAAGDDGAAGDSVYEQPKRIHGLELRLRSGAVAAQEALARLDPPAQHPEVRLYQRVVRAEALLLAGTAEAALAEAQSAVASARDHGYGVAEAEARQLACDALLVLGQEAALAEAAAGLAALAERMPSPRFARAAAFHAALSAGAPPELSALEALAAALAHAPDTALRARRLLGAEAAGDALDRAVVDAFAARTAWRPPAIVRGGPPPPDAARWTPGWGLDEARARAWLPDGRAVDLSRHPVQLGLLACLAAECGRASKEALVLAVWKGKDYHPLRDDNRLQAAVRKLRVQIEDDPSTPARVVTDSEGYALGGVFRWAR